MVPNNVDAKALLKTAKNTVGGSMNTFIVIQLVGQKLLKGNIDDMLSLMYSLQFQCYMGQF